MKKKQKKKVKKSFGTKLPRKRFAKSVRGTEQNETIETFMRLGAELQERRVGLGLTQKHAAELCNLQIATIGKIEKGNLGIKLGTLQTYLNLLNLELNLKEIEDLQ